MKYEFLVSDGNGAASRGGHVDTYSVYTIEANDEKEAYDKLVALIYNYDSLEDYLLHDYFCVDSYDELDEEEKEAFDTFDSKEYIENGDISGGDPWVEGLKVNGKVVIEPDIEGMLYYGFDLDASVYNSEFFDKEELYELEHSLDEDEFENTYYEDED